jgi:hypothetical protein
MAQQTQRMSNCLLARRRGECRRYDCPRVLGHRLLLPRFRLQQFVGEIAFIQKLTTICEYLRSIDVDSRKQVLRNRLGGVDMTPFCYVPLCSSLQPYHSILSVCAQEAHAFTTKARVPALMLFEVETHPDKLSAATFLGAVLHEYSERKLLQQPNPRSSALVTAHNSSEYLSADAVAEASHQAQQNEHDGHSKASHSSNTIFFDEEDSTSNRDDRKKSLMTVRMGWKDEDGSGTARKQSDGDSPITVGDIEVTEAVPAVTPSTESFHTKCERIRANSPYGHLPGWKLEGLLAKSNDDVRQEVFVMQLIQFYQNIFAEEVPELHLHTYKIMSCSQRTGVIQLITDAISLDGLKKSSGYPGTLRGHFEQTFGGGPVSDGNTADSTTSPNTSANNSSRSSSNNTVQVVNPEGLNAAVNEFVKSLAAYSLVCYLLAIKDRCELVPSEHLLLSVFSSACCDLQTQWQHHGGFPGPHHSH